MTIQQQLILDVREAARTISVHRSTVYELHKKDPSFPRIFKITPKKSGILASELAEWAIKQRASARIDGQQESGAA